MDLAQLWEWSGIALGSQADTQTLALSIRQLVNVKPLKSVRVWGKIFGTMKNYVIVEAEPKEGESDEEGELANQTYRNEPVAEALAIPVTSSGENGQEEKDGLSEEIDDGEFIPKPNPKVIAPLRIEERTGVNKYVYYVCHYRKYARLPTSVLILTHLIN